MPQTEVSATALDGTQPKRLKKRLESTLNVLDFGAVGDGVADDTDAISAAIDAARGRVVFFPSGSYLITRTIAHRLEGNLGMLGSPGTEILFSRPGSENLENGFLIDLNSFTLTLREIKFDGRQMVNKILRANNNGASMVEPESLSSVIVTACHFQRCYLRTTGPTEEAQGLLLQGGFRQVSIDNCKFTSMSRERGAGIAGSQGTSGMAVIHAGPAYSQHTAVTNCVFDDISNEEPAAAAANVDCDGLKVFAPESASEYGLASAYVAGNQFRNCRGRSVKCQIDMAKVIGNNFVRDKEAPITGGFAEINLQHGLGMVSNNTFNYQEVPGMPSAAVDNSTVVSFYVGRLSPRSVDYGGIVCAENVVYNNVRPEAGWLGNFICLETSLEAPNYAVVSNNIVIGGAVSHFMSVGTAGTNEVRHLSVNGNYATNVRDEFIRFGGSTSNLFITANGNVNGGTEIAFLNRDGEAPAAASIAGVGNRGFHEDYAVRASRMPNRSPSVRTSMLAPQGKNVGAITIQSKEVAHEGVASFEKAGYSAGCGLCFVSTNFNAYSQGVFATAGDAIIDLAGGAATSIEYSSSGANPDVDKKLNVWKSDNSVNVKNRLGSSRIVTLVFVG